MRKYQQAFLFVISGASLIFLLIYKSENNRLKYILHLVNFFGRKDAALMIHLENSTKDIDFTDFSYPLPAWQYIGHGFYAYSSFWKRNQLMVGGESIVLVVGRKSAKVNFKCALEYRNNITITGKFKFYHLNKSEITTNKMDFFSYKFFCKTNKEFGIPEQIILTGSLSNLSYSLLLRPEKSAMRHMQTATICVNMVDFKRSSNFAKQTNILQFFFYHQTIGIDNFFIYNGDAVPYHIRRILLKTNLIINYFPFNFPFVQDDKKEIRKLVEIDCLMRNSRQAKLIFLLDINEFVYPNKNILDSGSLLKALDHYDEGVNLFELASFGVCLDYKNKFLMDNTLYDPEVKFNHKLYAYKPTMRTESNKSVTLPLSLAFTHRYINCSNKEDGFYNWKKSLRQDFVKYLQSVRTKIGFMF